MMAVRSEHDERVSVANAMFAMLTSTHHLEPARRDPSRYHENFSLRFYRHNGEARELKMRPDG